MDSGEHFRGCPQDHTCQCETRRYARVLAIGVVIILLETVGGWLTNSLALYADAGHVGMDQGAVLLALIIGIVVRKRPHEEERLRSGGFLILIISLAALAAWIGVEAWERLWEPQEVIGPAVMVIAVLGGAGNYLQYRIVEGAGSHRMHRALKTHYETDFRQNVAVVISGATIWLTGWYWVDPILSVCIACLLLYQIALLLRGEHVD